jgi:Family of unknown function (DUF6510)
MFRVNAAMLAQTVWPASQHPLAFVCGPTSFVKTVAENLIGLGYHWNGSRPNGSAGPEKANGQEDRRALMDAVDGNTIGGLLIDVFGTEMTAADSICGTCGTSRPMAELVVYRQAPGTVVRCRTCGSVLMVFVTSHA